MPNVDGILLSTDFDTLKNDDAASTTLVVPGSVSIPGSVSSSSAHIVTADLDVGEAESLLNVRIQSSKEGAKYFLASVQFSLTRTGTVSGFPAIYSIYIFAVHAGGNTVRMTALIPNPYSTTLTGASGSETLTALVKTFQQPEFP